jgi:hypothetical protein
VRGIMSPHLARVSRFGLCHCHVCWLGWLIVSTCLVCAVIVAISFTCIVCLSVRKDADVAEVIKENKCKMFNPSDIFPDTRYGKVALQKELARRTAVMNAREHERIPRCENYTIIQLVSELQKCPHEQARLLGWIQARVARPLSLHFQQHRG